LTEIYSKNVGLSTLRMGQITMTVVKKAKCYNELLFLSKQQ